MIVQEEVRLHSEMAYMSDIVVHPSFQGPTPDLTTAQSETITAPKNQPPAVGPRYNATASSPLGDWVGLLTRTNKFSDVDFITVTHILFRDDSHSPLRSRER
jgi:hypothetical protein